MHVLLGQRLDAADTEEGLRGEIGAVGKVEDCLLGVFVFRIRECAWRLGGHLWGRCCWMWRSAGSLRDKLWP